MNFEREQVLRNEAESLRRSGHALWSERLQANGLDPYRWSSDPQAETRQLSNRAAPLDAQSFDEADNTIEVVWTTGAAVTRDSYEYGTFSEVLDVTPQAVRLGRLNAGAPFLDSHDSSELGRVLGSVVPGSARLAGGKGICRILLSKAAGSADRVADIKAGVIRNISVGYRIHAAVWTEASGAKLATCRITDWEPLEISAVAIPADAGSQVRGGYSSMFRSRIFCC